MTNKSHLLITCLFFSTAKSRLLLSGLVSLIYGLISKYYNNCAKKSLWKGLDLVSHQYLIYYR